LLFFFHYLLFSEKREKYYLLFLANVLQYIPGLKEKRHETEEMLPHFMMGIHVILSACKRCKNNAAKPQKKKRRNPV